MTSPTSDSFKSLKSLTVGAKSYDYYSLAEAEKNGLAGISRLPFSLKVLLENLLRHEDGRSVTAEDIRGIADWLDQRHRSDREIAFRPARVLMQDFTGVPAVVDLAAMRDAMQALGGDPERINPLVPVDLVIDHSVMVDDFGNAARLRAERRARIRAQRRALPLPPLGPVGLPRISASCRRAPASATRSTSNISRRPCGRSQEGGQTSSPIPTRWSAPTATPPWSTASPCSAGASAASRRRRRCSASRSRC